MADIMIKKFKSHEIVHYYDPLVKSEKDQSLKGPTIYTKTCLSYLL